MCIIVSLLYKLLPYGAVKSWRSALLWHHGVRDWWSWGTEIRSWIRAKGKALAGWAGTVLLHPGHFIKSFLFQLYDAYRNQTIDKCNNTKKNIQPFPNALEHTPHPCGSAEDKLTSITSWLTPFPGLLVTLRTALLTEVERWPMDLPWPLLAFPVIRTHSACLFTFLRTLSLSREDSKPLSSPWIHYRFGAAGKNSHT